MSSSRKYFLTVCSLLISLPFCGCPSPSPQVGGGAGASLTIGSAAPPLDVEHWVHADKHDLPKVTKFESGKVYVVEFWATWCPPCVASMPHLAELQTKYKDQGVQIISISDEDLETVNGFLQRPYTAAESKSEAGAEADKQPGPTTYGELTMAYSLTTDPDGSSSEDYMRAAGQDGIPTAFIVGKSGLVEWIGHPMMMDKPLEEVLAGTWDRVAFLEKQAQEQQARIALREMLGDIEAVQALTEKRDYDTALARIDELIKNAQFPEVELQLSIQRMNILRASAPEKAAEALKKVGELIGDEPAQINTLTWGLYEEMAAEEEPNKELLKAAITLTERAVELAPQDGAIIDTLAHLVYLDGDLARALELQTKAVENAGEFIDQLEPFLKQLQEEKAKQQ